MAESKPQAAYPNPQRPIECQVPVGSDLAAPAFPDRPTLFNEVEWGAFPSDEDISKAYKLWSIPNETLTASHPSTSVPSACLARNVYESILTSSNLSVDKDQFVRHSREADEDSTVWTYNEIFGTEPEEQQRMLDTNTPTVLVHGYDPLIDTKYWTKAKLQPELRSRGIDANALVQTLRQRLYDDELQKLQVAAPPRKEDKGSILPFQDLSEWGIQRAPEDSMLRISSHGRFSALDMYTWAISLSPYNPTYWTSRAYLHYQMGHFDLALGDAYRAQLLCEKLVNPLKRHIQPGLYIRIWDAIERHILQIHDEEAELPKEVELVRTGNGVNHFVPILRKTIHHIIVLSLLAMQCWEDYAATEPYLRTRLVMADRDNIAIQQREAKLAEFTRDAAKEKRHNYLEYFFERHYGFITCRQYPYESWDSVHALSEIAQRINEDMINKSQAQAYRPQHLEVSVDGGHRLAVYADEDVPKGAVIYVDEPSIRGHLQCLSRSSQHRCENCKRPVTAIPPILWFDKGKKDSQAASSREPRCDCANFYRTPLYWCAAGNDSTSLTPKSTRSSSPAHTSRKTRSHAESFDSEDEQSIGRGNSSKRQKTGNNVATSAKNSVSCLEIARSLYHNRVCGKDWKWLHDAMRPNRWPEGSVPEELGTLSHTNEQHGTLLSLLLREVFDITLLRRQTDNKPNLLAYEIDELMPILQWSSLGKNVPFSFAANIQVPFDILSCLGVNIFRDLSFDTWVIQVVLRKLLLCAIPWRSSDDDGDKDIPESQKEKIKRTKEITKISDKDADEAMPSFPNLYVFPVLSIFKHACPPHHNVDWHWDTEIPNRLILHANRAIRGGEELFVRYSRLTLPNDTAHRLFGRACDCAGCGRGDLTPDMHMPDEYYGNTTSEDEGPEPEEPSSSAKPRDGSFSAKPRDGALDHNPTQESPPGPGQDETSGDNQESEGSSEQRSEETVEGAEAEDENQEELEDYQSSSHEERADSENQEPLNSILEADRFLAQQALGLLPSYGQGHAPAPINNSDQSTQRDSTRSPGQMLPPQQSFEMSPDYSNIRPLPVPRPPLRRRGTIRHNGVMMTIQEFNTLHMEEATNRQHEEYEQQEVQLEQHRDTSQDRNDDRDHI